MKKTLKKGFTIAVSVMTITWSIGIAAFAPLSAAASEAAVAPGELVKASLAALYYVGNDGKRYVFPNEKTYKTWWSDFSTVKTITDSELAAVAIGGNVTYRPGAQLVKITTDPKVYMVGANAQLHSIADEATALALFGSNWATKIQDVPDAFFTNYTVASGNVNANAIGAAMAPIGTIGMLGSDYYVATSAGHSMLTGVNSAVLAAVIMFSDQAALNTWFGSTMGSAMPFAGVTTPDRKGTLEGGSGTPPPTSGADWSLTVTSGVDKTANASNGTVFTLGHVELNICYNGSGSVTVDAWTFDSGRGTVSFNSNATVHVEGDGFFAKLTSSDDTKGVAEVIEGNGLTFGTGECNEVMVMGGTTSTSGLFILDLTGMTVNGSAVVLSSAIELMNRSAVTILSSDISVISFNSPVGPGTVEPGEQVRLFQYQLSVSGNEANVPHLVFDTSGTLDVTNCFATRNGNVITGDWMWVGSFMVFMVNESDQFFNDQSYTIELWCDVWGQAGQTIGIDVEYPAPMFIFIDAQRNVFVAPTVTTLTLSATFTINGSSATVTNVNLATSVTGLNQSSGSGDQISNGTSNATVAVFLVEIRGSRATLNSLNLQMIQAQTGTAEGLTNCETYISNLPGAAEIDESNVDLGAMNRSQVGSTVSPNLATIVTVNFSKVLNVGDYVIIVECDANPSGVDTTYEANDIVGLQLTAGSSNISFDIGGSVNFPSGTVQGTLVTVVLLSGISVQADSTSLNVVSNASNKAMGEYVILGPSTENVLITSVTIAFAAGVNNGSCTTVRVKTKDGENQSQSQALSGAAAIQTLTFSMNFTVQSNSERTLVVECTQAGTVTPGTVVAATTLNALSGSGASSGQALNFTTVTAGGSVIFSAAVVITTAQSTLPPQQFLGQNETLTGNKVSVQLTNAEGASLTNVAATITQNSAAALQNIKTVKFFIEGATVAGTYASAATEICSRTVTNVTPNCTFNPGQIKVAAGSNAVITVEATGPNAGDSNQPDPTNDTLSVDVVNQTGITMKGLDSGITVNDAAGLTTFTGRVLTPLNGQLRVVSKATGAASILPGQTDMPIGNFDLIVGSGSNIQLNALGGNCNTNDAAAVCLGTDNIDLVIDGTVQATVAIAASAYVFPGLTLLNTSGTHDYELRVDATGCSTNDNIQLTMNQYDFTIGGVAYTTLAARLADLNTFAANNMTFESNLCG